VKAYSWLHEARKCAGKAHEPNCYVAVKKKISYREGEETLGYGSAVGGWRKAMYEHLVELCVH